MSAKMDMISYYENGAQRKSDKRPRADAQKYKDAAKRYLVMLDKAYYKDDNARGVQALYWLLKSEHEDDGDHPKKYPPRRFVKDWLSQQATHQVTKRKKGISKTIQSIILNRPNELIQVDYVYMFRNIAEEIIVEDEDNANKDKIKEQNELFKKEGIKWRGAITAIDCFSRYAYVVPIEGVLNSSKAAEAMQRIIRKAEDRYPGRRIRRIQTDKGPEFEKEFRKLLKEKTAQHIGFYKHVYGYEGRSQSQGIVERFNGTYRRMLSAVLGKEVLTPKWKHKSDTIVANYNKTPHCP